MRILITGATGFIGSQLVSCLEDQHEIFTIVRKKPTGDAPSGVNWIEQDLSQNLDNTRLPGQIDAIIHLAQSRYYRDFPKHSCDIFQVNLASTLSLLEYGRKNGIQKFIYASSGGIYGYSYHKFVETTGVNPMNLYSTTKYSSELLIGNYSAYFSTVIFRFFFVYGPKQQGMLIPKLLSNIRQGENIVIFGKYGVLINPIHIRDAIKVFEPSLQHNMTGIFNIAGDEIISIKGLAELIAQYVGKAPKFVYEKSSISGDIIGDNSRMKAVLGITPEVSLKSGISEVVLSSGDDNI